MHAHIHVLAVHMSRSLYKHHHPYTHTCAYGARESARKSKSPVHRISFRYFPGQQPPRSPCIFSKYVFSFSSFPYPDGTPIPATTARDDGVYIYSHFDTVTPRGNCRRRRSQRAAAGGARGVLSLSLLFAPRQWQDERAAAELFPARRVQARQKKNSAATPPPLGHFGDFRAKRVSSFVRRGIDCFVGAKRVGHPRERRKG